jgi:hypothetical protein
MYAEIENPIRNEMKNIGIKTNNDATAMPPAALLLSYFADTLN